MGDGDDWKHLSFIISKNGLCITCMVFGSSNIAQDTRLRLTKSCPPGTRNSDIFRVWATVAHFPGFEARTKFGNTTFAWKSCGLCHMRVITG